VVVCVTEADPGVAVWFIRYVNVYDCVGVEGQQGREGVMVGKYQTVTVPVTVSVPDHWTAGDVRDELWSIVNDTVEDTMLSIVRSGGAS